MSYRMPKRCLIEKYYWVLGVFEVLWVFWGIIVCTTVLQHYCTTVVMLSDAKIFYISVFRKNAGNEYASQKLLITILKKALLETLQAHSNRTKSKWWISFTYASL